jgi:hypothetical protein
MPKFDFEMSVPLESKVAFEKIHKFLTSENSFKKFDQNLVCTFDESQRSCQLNGRQFKASLKIKDQAAQQSQVSIEVDLPFALSLFKGKIKD